MTETKQNTPLRPRLTIAFWSFALGVASTVATVSVHYGRQESDLSNSKERIEDFKKANDDLVDSLKKWREAYDAQAANLRSAESRVHQLENDRCNPIKLDIDEIRSGIDVASRYENAERTASLKEMMEQYQQTLRACYAASSSATRG